VPPQRQRPHFLLLPFRVRSLRSHARCFSLLLFCFGLLVPAFVLFLAGQVVPSWSDSPFASFNPSLVSRARTAAWRYAPPYGYCHSASRLMPFGQLYYSSPYFAYTRLHDPPPTSSSTGPAVSQASCCRLGVSWLPSWRLFYSPPSRPSPSAAALFFIPFSWRASLPIRLLAPGRVFFSSFPIASIFFRLL